MSSWQATKSPATREENSTFCQQKGDLTLLSLKVTKLLKEVTKLLIGRRTSRCCWATRGEFHPYSSSSSNVEKSRLTQGQSTGQNVDDILGPEQKDRPGLILRSVLRVSAAPMGEKAKKQQQQQQQPDWDGVKISTCQDTITTRQSCERDDFPPSTTIGDELLGQHCLRQLTE